MKTDDLRRKLAERAPGHWELYEKTAESWETEATRDLRRSTRHREEGLAARWWEDGGPRFAAATNPSELEGAIPEAARIGASVDPPPEWPSRKAASVAAAEAGAPPDLFEELTRAVGTVSRGEAVLTSVSLRRGRIAERIRNGAGLDVEQGQALFGGVASAVARRGARAREARLAFRWSGAPEIEALARRLSDAATLPLSDRPAPFAAGQWLLDPSVGAALLAALSPIFSTPRPPRWIAHGRLAATEVTIADDATPDAPFDGEGVASRRVVLVEDGRRAGHLDDLRSARRSGRPPSGHGTRPSFRVPPTAGPRRIFLEARQPATPDALLSSVTRGIFAAALTAPVRLDLEGDRYEVEFTGVSVAGGRAQGPVAGARTSGRISELLQRISGVSADRQFFPMPFPCGSPTILVERVKFE